MAYRWFILGWDLEGIERAQSEWVLNKLCVCVWSMLSCLALPRWVGLDMMKPLKRPIVG